MVKAEFDSNEIFSGSPGRVSRLSADVDMGCNPRSTWPMHLEVCIQDQLSWSAESEGFLDIVITIVQRWKCVWEVKKKTKLSYDFKMNRKWKSVIRQRLTDFPSLRLSASSWDLYSLVVPCILFLFFLCVFFFVYFLSCVSGIYCSKIPFPCRTQCPRI